MITKNFEAKNNPESIPFKSDNIHFLTHALHVLKEAIWLILPMKRTHSAHQSEIGVTFKEGSPSKGKSLSF